MAVWRSLTQSVASAEQFSLVPKKTPWHCPWSLFGLRINEERSWSQPKALNSPIPTSVSWEAGAHAELTFPSKSDPGGTVTDISDLETELLHHWVTAEAELWWIGTMTQSHLSRTNFLSWENRDILRGNFHVCCWKCIQKFYGTSPEGQSSTVSVNVSGAIVQNMLPRNPKLPLLFPVLLWSCVSPWRLVEPGREKEGRWTDWKIVRLWSDACWISFNRPIKFTAFLQNTWFPWASLFCWKISKMFAVTLLMLILK